MKVTPPPPANVAPAADARPLPRVLVLLATYNGARFLPEQLDSLRRQQGVRLSVAVSDDGSTDGTLALLQAAAADPSLDLRIVSSGERQGGACRNFLHLIGRVDAGAHDAVALCDQDDIWLPTKLQRACARLAETGSDGYSSNSLPFWEDGRERLVRKDYPQTDSDHLFESASHGCTFVVTRGLFQDFQRWLADAPEAVRTLDYHDWLLYAWARRQGRRWWLDDQALIRYRQSAHNVIGANVGGSAIRARLRQLSQGWLRRQTLRQLEVLGATDLPEYRRLLRFCVADRLWLACRAHHYRRRPLHRLVFALSLLTIGI